MRRLRRAWLALAAAVVLLAGGVAGAAPSAWQGLPTVRVVLDGQEVPSDVPAVILGNRTLLPVRALAEALGLKVSWDAKTRTAALTSQNGLGLTPGQALVQLADQGVVLTLRNVAGPAPSRSPDSAAWAIATVKNTTDQAYSLQGWTPVLGTLPPSQEGQTGARPIVLYCSNGVAVFNYSWCKFLDPQASTPLARATLTTPDGQKLPDTLAPGASLDVLITFDLASAAPFQARQLVLSLGDFGALILPNPNGCAPQAPLPPVFSILHLPPQYTC